MRTQRTAPDRGIVVAHGYGIKLYVERGHLTVHYGVGRKRETHRYNRATSKVNRVVVIGHTGYVTLEALRWITDVGATFVQIDSDANLITLSAPARHHESKLRRAQVLAAENPVGRLATVELLKAKLGRQAQVAERLAHLKATVRVKDAHPIAVADAIREYAALLDPALPFARLREIESAAGRNYWQTWAHLPVRFDATWRGAMPDHWHHAGPRTSWVDGKRARKATTPVHAMVNYLYAILESEATIAAHKLGFDPSLGIMHADQRYRSSLAADLMEPARPAGDEIALATLADRPLTRGDIFETREGVCRIGPPSPDGSPATRPHYEPRSRHMPNSSRAPSSTRPTTPRPSRDGGISPRLVREQCRSRLPGFRSCTRRSGCSLQGFGCTKIHPRLRWSGLRRLRSAWPLCKRG